MPPAPVRVLGQKPLATSVMSVMSVVNDKGDNEVLGGGGYLILFVSKIVKIAYFIYILKIIILMLFFL